MQRSVVRRYNHKTILDLGFSTGSPPNKSNKTTLFDQNHTLSPGWLISFVLHPLHFFNSLHANFFLSVPATRNEYQTIKQQLEVEKIPGVNPGDPTRSFHSLTLAEQAQMEKKRLQGKMCSANKSDVILGSRFSGMKRVCAFKS